MAAVSRARVASSRVSAAARAVVAMFLVGEHMRTAIDEPFSLRLHVVVARVAFFQIGQQS